MRAASGVGAMALRVPSKSAKRPKRPPVKSGAKVAKSSMMRDGEHTTATGVVWRGGFARRG